MVKAGPSVAEKQEERVAKVVASVSDAGLDEGLSMEEEAVLARELLTEKEKLKTVCFDFNKPGGCGRGSCKFKHACSFVDRNKPGWVCMDVGHNRINHK